MVNGNSEDSYSSYQKILGKKRSSHVFHDDDNSSIKKVSFISSGNLPSFIIAKCPQS